MQDHLKGTTVPSEPHHPNAFTVSFLDRLAERDEPPTAGDADVAGPWRIEPIVWNGGHGFGLFRMGESLGRGFSPTAVFPSRWLALLMAGILPGTGRDPLLILSKQPDAHGAYPVALAGGSDGGVDRLTPRGKLGPRNPDSDPDLAIGHMPDMVGAVDNSDGHERPRYGRGSGQPSCRRVRPPLQRLSCRHSLPTNTSTC